MSFLIYLIFLIDGLHRSCDIITPVQQSQTCSAVTSLGLFCKLSLAHLKRRCGSQTREMKLEHNQFLGQLTADLSGPRHWDAYSPVHLWKAAPVLQEPADSATAGTLAHSGAAVD